jgi:hypothetical protein
MAYKYPELPKEVYWDDLEENIRTLMVEYDVNLRKWHNKKNRAACQRARKALINMIALFKEKRKELLTDMIFLGHRKHQSWVYAEKYKKEIWEDNQHTRELNLKKLKKEGLIDA